MTIKERIAKEERKAPRVDFHLELEIWGHRGPNKIMDLSTSGLFIQTENPFQYKTGDEIDLVLKFPTEEEAMLLKAQVVRITIIGIGARFINITPHSAQIIETCYNAFKDTVPSDDS